MKYQILLFYKYTRIADTQKEMQWQKNICVELGLTCRTIVSPEGINATLEGTVEATEKYIARMTARSEFSNIHWKKSPGTGTSFPRISVKVRDEIVSLKLGDFDFDPNDTTGEYITAEELHDLYQSGEEFYVVDMRNDYEMKVGHFKDAILMPMKNFRELPEALPKIEHLKDKIVITTCTGGIRCEKASGFLVKHGFTRVYQLWGGMQTYMEEYPNGFFEGSLYVFDGRTTWYPASAERKVISSCDICTKSSDRYVDCGYLHCTGHRHFICCDDCLDEQGYAFCSQTCRELAYRDKKFSKKRYAVQQVDAQV